MLELNDKPHYLGHRKRVKQKFLQSPATFADYELLELLLFSAHLRKDVKPLAKKLLADFGSISAVFNANPSVLQSYLGVNENVLLILKLNQEIISRLAKEKLINRPVIESWQQLVEYCQIDMNNLEDEQFRVLFLDKKQHLISDKVLKIYGGNENVEIDLRLIVKTALNCFANFVILVHNHPNNSPQPSEADIKTTKEIINSLKPIKVKVYDHLIIGQNNQFFSFKNEGFL